MNWRAHFRRLAFIPLVAAGVGFLTVPLYWGYWFSPPPVDRVLGGIVEVERFTALFASKLDASILTRDTAVPSEYFSPKDYALSGVRGIEREPWRVETDVGCSPLGRFTRALGDARLLPTTDEPVDPARVRAARDALLAEGMWKGGFTSFAYPPAPYAEFAQAIDGSGNRFLLVVFPEPQISNDHFPYTEARLREGPEGRYELDAATRFRFDHAGMEGIMHWFLGIGSGIFLLGVWIFVTLSALLARFVESFSSRPPTATGSQIL